MSKSPAFSIAAAAAALLAAPAPAMAHSFGQIYTLPVPFWLYAWAGAATVVVSFVIVGVFLTTSPGAGVHPAARERRVYALPGAVVRALQVISVLGLALCIATGLFGTRVSYANFNMTFFWIVFVLGFAYLTALIGDLYALISPWRALSELISSVFPRFSQGRFVYPERAAYWPAIALFAAFIWIELFARNTPLSLAAALSAYTLINIAAVWLVGARSWFHYCEIFSVFLRLIARIAPVEFVTDAGGQPSRRFRLRRPFAGALEGVPDHPTLMLFCLFMLSATAFDGLHEGRPWVKLFWSTLYPNLLADWVGHNPFAAFPALLKIYSWWQTAWLLLSPFIYVGVYLCAVYLMYRVTARRVPVRELALRFLYSLLPIVLVYHITHYYTLIQTQGVKIVALVSDPFGYGWNLFGTANWFRGTLVPDVTTVWHAQVALILLGHITSVVLAHFEALRIFRDRRTAVISQLPMLALMVSFTVFGLWILSLPLQTPSPG